LQLAVVVVVVLGDLLTYVLSSVEKRASHSQRKGEREAPSVWSGVKLVGGGRGGGGQWGAFAACQKVLLPSTLKMTLQVRYSFLPFTQSP
jgi:hypothetical protein